MSDEAAARVIVVDDETLVVEGLCALLRPCPDMTVVASGRTVHELTASLEAFGADIVVTGHGLGDADVAGVVRRVGDVCASARVVVLADTASNARVSVAMDAGAHGYLVRTQSGEELVAALRVVMSGGYVLAPAAIDALIGRSRGLDDRIALSPRERDVLQVVSRTGSARKAADELAISFNTARNHLQRAITKLGVHSTVDAVVVALNERLIEPPERTIP